MIGNWTGDALVHGALLVGRVEVGHAQGPLVGAGRILGHEVGARRVDRLAMDRHGIGQVPGDGAGLAVAEGHDVLLEADALDAAGQVGGPGDGTESIGAALP
jgi:hypothetical protein